MESLVKIFIEAVNLVKDNPKVSATVVTVIFAYLAGRGDGYREGRREVDGYLYGSTFPRQIQQ